MCSWVSGVKSMLKTNNREFEQKNPEADQFEWVHASVEDCDHLLDRAVKVGTETHDDSTIYVGRTSFGGDTVPCKVIPKHKVAYVAHGDKEVGVYNVELYCRKLPPISWVAGSKGYIPEGAVSAGTNKNGEAYVGRTRFKGTIFPGRVSSTKKCIYITCEGKSITRNDYEVLCVSK